MSEQRNKQEYSKLREMQVSDQVCGLVQSIVPMLIPDVNHRTLVM